MPPGALVITEDTLRLLAKELTTSVANVFQQALGTTKESIISETTVSQIADSVVSKVVEAAKKVQHTQA